MIKFFIVIIFFFFVVVVFFDSFNSLLNVVIKTKRIYCKVCNSRIGDIEDEQCVSITKFRVMRIAPFRLVSICGDKNHQGNSHSHAYATIFAESTIHMKVNNPTFMSVINGVLTSNYCSDSDTDFSRFFSLFPHLFGRGTSSAVAVPNILDPFLCYLKSYLEEEAKDAANKYSLDSIQRAVLKAQLKYVTQSHSHDYQSGEMVCINENNFLFPFNLLFELCRVSRLRK